MAEDKGLILLPISMKIADEYLLCCASSEENVPLRPQNDIFRKTTCTKQIAESVKGL